MRLETPSQFSGVLHARDYRQPSCTSYGTGHNVTVLNINMVAEDGTDQYCGVFINQVGSGDTVLPVTREVWRQGGCCGCLSCHP